MAEDNWYSNGNNNWNATNAWNTQADGGGTALSDPDADAHVIIQGNDTITITAAIGNTIKSLTIDSGSDLDGHASHIIETTAEGTASFGSEHYAVKINGTTDSNVNITVGGTFDTRLDLDGTMGNLILKGSGEKEFRGTPTIGGNVTIQDSCDATCAGAVQINGNLTITSGSYNTTSAGNHALTVTGATNIDGTLTCNASTVSLGSDLLTAYALTGSGTCDLGTGTVTIGACNWGGVTGLTKTSGTITFDTKKTGGQGIGPSCAGKHFNFGTSTVNIGPNAASSSNYTVEMHSGSDQTFKLTCGTLYIKSNTQIYNNDTDYNTWEINGDLDITAGKYLATYYDTSVDYSSPIVVTGNVTVNGDLIAYNYDGPNDTAVPTDLTFGSLSIPSGGKYYATTGTTTITGGFRPADVAGTLNLYGGAWEFGGTGGLFEGDFLKTEREVRINQDTVGDYVGADRVTISDATPIRYAGSGAVTWSCWIYAKGLGGNNNGRVFDKGHAQIYLSDDSGAGDFFITGTVKYATTDATTVTNQGLYFNTWYHVALVYQKTGVDQCKIYVNGIEQTYSTQNTGDVAGSPNSDTGEHLIIGNNSAGNRGFYGQLADFKYYPTNLSQAQIAQLASKINFHPNKVTSPAQSNKIWAKLTNESTVDETGYGLTIAYTNPPDTWSSPFSVDIQDNTTTVSNLIVESGQLNTKALTSKHFDGVNDIIRTGSTIATATGAKMTASMWFNCDVIENSTWLLGNGAGAGDWYVPTDGWVIFLRSPAAGTEVLKCGVEGQQVNPVPADLSAVITANRWYHLTVTFDGTGVAWYLDGVNVGTATMGSPIEAQTLQVFAGYSTENNTNPTAMDGKMRDIRIYDGTVLSADQAASLYRGSYNVTPTYWWKIDATGDPAGSGTNTQGMNEVSGTGHSEGTLKVNGAARVLDNGSVS